jgi:hypothetical protein
MSAGRVLRVRSSGIYGKMTCNLFMNNAGPEECDSKVNEISLFYGRLF